MSRIPKNEAEAAFWYYATSQGWDITKRGWPDFACFKGDDLILVEVKPKRSHSLKKEQLRLMTALDKRGINCYRWSPDTGLVRISAPRSL